MKLWQKRLLVVLLLALTGGFLGWLSFNLVLDFLLGGRTFA